MLTTEPTPQLWASGPSEVGDSRQRSDHEPTKGELVKALRLAGWKSESGHQDYLRAYGEALRLWPVPYESIEIETRFGITNAVMSGPPNHPALLLLPAAIGIGALQWYPNVPTLASDHRVYALDFVGAPGRGRQTSALIDRHDYAAWLVDVLDRLGLDKARFVGSSQGGWMVLNLCIHEPDRVEAAALLGPAASIAPFNIQTVVSLRLPTPSWAAGPALKAILGAPADERLVRVMAAGLSHFRYQERAVYPDMFGETALRRVRVPTLIMVGDKEIIYEPKAALERAERLIADAQTELVPGAGHLPNMQMPDIVNDRLARFFSALLATVG